MSQIKKIIHCSPEQYMELLKNGQVEIDGEIKYYDTEVLYNTGELELLEWYNKIMEAQHKEFEVMHTPVVTNTLEEDYNAILAEYPDYTYSSAIGYRAFLKKSDVIEIESHYNNGEVFINRERVTSNYLCRSEGVEDVRVWVFESGIYIKDVPALQPVLGAIPTYYPYEIHIRNVPAGKTPEVAQEYYLYANKITTYDFNLPVAPRACRVLIANGTNDFTQKKSSYTQEVYSNCVKLTTTTFKNEVYLQKLSLPNCIEINSKGATGGLINCSQPVDFEWGKLEKLAGGTNAGTNALFVNIHTLTIPSTVKNMTNIIVRDCQNLGLECNKAEFISSNWCYQKPTVSFSMAKDWDATINISKAAEGWEPSQFKTLFESLVDHKDDDNINPENLKYITVPSAIYDQLYNDGITDIALSKGWVID